MPATIRLANESDAGPILDIYTPVVRATTISFEWEPPSVSEIRHRMRNDM